MPTAGAAQTTDWVARYDELSGRRGALSGVEFDELGLAAWFLGRYADVESSWNSAYLAHLEAGDADAAVRSAFWLTFTLFEHDEVVRGRAWVARLFELCESNPNGQSEAIATLCKGVMAFTTGQVPDAVELGMRAAALARDVGDLDTEVLATMNLARALLASGRIEEGFARMDRVMLAVASGSISDRVAGPAYCAVIASCLERWDVERARIWTRDLGDWCDAQRGLEPFRGECSVNRATVLRLGGEWGEAEATLTDVCAREGRVQTLENALYSLGDLQRLSGRSDDAEALYRRASELGREVQPGLALLRRDLGSSSVARSGIARALEASPRPGMRAELLATQIELEVEHGDIELARHAVVELVAMADLFDTTFLHAQADRARALVLMATDAATEALPLLRRSWGGWRALDAPYEAAITRMLLGRASRALGDEEAAQLEFDAARNVLSDLGAIPDLDRLERLAASPDQLPAAGGLSRREVEVLRLVAGGRSNRQIATDLFLSEHTVARHVSNILAKLGLANRAAATAFAFENGLNAPA